MEENKTKRTIKPLIFLSETPNEKQFDTRFEEIYANTGIDDAEMAIMSGRGELTKDFYERFMEFTPKNQHLMSFTIDLEALRKYHPTAKKLYVITRIDEEYI